MELSDIARTIEDAINRKGIVNLRARGWLPRILPYTGYGSVTSVRILGRAIMADPHNRLPSILSTLPTSAHSAFLPNELSDVLNPVFDIATQQAEYVQRGFHAFFTTQVGYLPVTINIGEREYRTRTDRAGYIDFVADNHELTPGWHTVTLTPAQGESVQASVMIVSPQARIGLISDVDDTIVVTNLPRPISAAWNAFALQTSARQAVPGMANFYRELLADTPEAPVFYISTGAWNTVPAMQAFIEANGYPNGPMLFTDWGPTPTGLFRNGQAHKKQQLRNLLITFPDITWILVGDDGQHDPYLYDELAREHPSRIRGLAFRELDPVEQVLSHGTLGALDTNKHTPHAEDTPFFRIAGHTGMELSRAWKQCQ